MSVDGNIVMAEHAVSNGKSGAAANLRGADDDAERLPAARAWRQGRTPADLHPAVAAWYGVTRDVNPSHQVESDSPTRELIVLLIDNDAQTAHRVADEFAQHSCKVIVETDAGKALATVNEVQPDAVVLDIELARMDGFRLCAQLRERSNIPLIVYTARCGDINHVLALQGGADDFVAKSIEPRVLFARLEALFRRVCRTAPAAPADASPEVLVIGDFRISQVSQEATFKGKVIDLTGAEFQMFLLLARNRGKVVARDRLLTQLDGKHYDGMTRTLHSRAYRIRAKLEQVGASPSTIRAIRSMGYMFALDE